MNNQITLISLAMLKVNFDIKRCDYLEYLKPFVLCVLSTKSFEIINDEEVSRTVEDVFGLKIPHRVINRLLTRLAKKKILEKNGETFKCNKSNIPLFDIEAEKTKAKLHIDRISKALLEFSKDKTHQIINSLEALDILLFFLSKFSIECLKTYIFGNTIPVPPTKTHKHIVLVSQFVRHIYNNEAALFNSFMILAKGHMLANALTCPDLDSLNQTFSKVTFFLDTPFAIQLLGLGGPEKEKAAKETVISARKKSAKFAIFTHTSQELYSVIKGAAKNLDSPYGKGNIVRESRKVGKTYTDLFLIAEKREELLLRDGVKTLNTPNYDDHSFQIGELAFEELLESELEYNNPIAKSFDVNLVRSIYALRRGSAPCRLEEAKATLVTSNSKFAQLAFKYGKQFESTQEVSSVMTDFSLANITWLKSPMAAPDLPKAEILSYAYAALNPSEALWTKYLLESDKLKSDSQITERDHALIRSTLSIDPLMEMTLGEESALTSKGIYEILEETKRALTKEQEQKLLEEKSSA